MRVISLTTDFGIKNGFVGVMKGVIYGIAPQVHIVDISHTITAQDIHEGSLALWRAYSFFPAESIHVFVVDPGVGTGRRALAAKIDRHFFVGPDNGLLTPIIEEAEASGGMLDFVDLNNQDYWLPKVSRTFHGRDIFSPVAAHLANGVPLHDLGAPIMDPARMKLFRPERTPAGWRTHITVIDIFGNLTTDLRADFIMEEGRIPRFRLGGIEIIGIAESYGHHPVGEFVAVVDSEEYIELAVVNGNAAERLNAKVGDIVEVILSE
jgi:hypothetical protein